MNRSIPNTSASWDEISALIKEIRIDTEEFCEDIEKIHGELKEYLERQIENEEKIRDIDKDFKHKDCEFDTPWSRLVEFLVDVNLPALLQESGMTGRQINPNTKVSFVREDDDLQHKEFDILAVNETEAVAVEVETVLTPDDVRLFLSAMEDFKRFIPEVFPSPEVTC